jgi:hypothetical protein
MSAVLDFATVSVWNRIADGLQRATLVEREEIFPAGELMPISLPELAHVSYVGWVGPRFDGTLIVGKNPGGGGDSQALVRGHDRAVADALQRFKSAPTAGAGAALLRVYQAYTVQSPGIGMGTLMDRVLGALGEERDTVAFMNLCPFRTRMDEDFDAGATRRCVSLVLAPVVQALQPDTVVLLGAVARRAAPHLQARWVYRVPRGRNDKQLNPKAAAVLEDMRSSRSERVVGRARR